MLGMPKVLVVTDAGFMDVLFEKTAHEESVCEGAPLKRDQSDAIPHTDPHTPT